MNIRNFAVPATAVAFALSFGIANAASALSVSCAGSPAASSITWTAAASGGVTPIAFLWGNGSTSTSQTLPYAPGTYSMNIQATDASSSVATSTCAATVALPQTAPVITSFTANPAAITSGQSTTLSWNVSNASSTTINNGVGVVSGTSTTVAPTTNTTYTLTAVNPAGTTTAQTLVVVNATTTPLSIQAQIAVLLQQIAQLQQQIRNLIMQGSGFGTTTPPVIIPPGENGKDMCISLSRDLREGDDGDDVMQIQQMLANDPNSGFTVTPTGFFGPMTVRAMMHFQEENDIVVSGSGWVGPLTRGFFERRCGEGLGDHGSNDTGSSSAASSAQTPGISVNGAASSSAQNQIMLPWNWSGGHGHDEEHGNGHGHGNDD